MGQAMDVGDNWPKSVKMAGAAMLPGLVPQPPRLAKHGGRRYFAAFWTRWTPWTPLCTQIFENWVYGTAVTAKNHNGNARPACPEGSTGPPVTTTPLFLDVD